MDQDQIEPTAADPESQTRSPRRRDAKRKAILDAAAAIFPEAGFAGASMDEISRRANVSKATLYAHFPSKTALFSAVIETYCEKAFPADVGRFDPHDPESSLTKIGMMLTDLMWSAAPVAMFRVVVAEGARFPELSETMFQAGPVRTVTVIEDYLKAANAAGSLKVPDPRLAAQILAASFRGKLLTRMLFGIAPCGVEAHRAHRDRLVAEMVRLFMAGYRP